MLGPRPWRWHDNHYTLLDANGKEVLCGVGDYGYECEIEIDEKHAQHILRAVNCHDELVAACEAVAAHCEASCDEQDQEECARKRPKLGDEQGPYCDASGDMILIRAAIAEAKEGTND